MDKYCIRCKCLNRCKPKKFCFLYNPCLIKAALAALVVVGSAYVLYNLFFACHYLVDDGYRVY